MIVYLFVIFICCDCLCCSMFNRFFSVFFLFSCFGFASLVTLTFGPVSGNKLAFWPVEKSLFVGMLFVFSVIFVCLCYCLHCCLLILPFVCLVVYLCCVGWFIALFWCSFDFVVLYTPACLLDRSLCNSLESSHFCFLFFVFYSLFIFVFVSFLFSFICL